MMIYGKLGDIYYVWGASIVGGIIATSIANLIDIIGLTLIKGLTWGKPFIYLTLLITILSIIYFGHKNRHEVIYEEMKNLNPKVKRKYRILNIIHVVLVLGIFFTLSDIKRTMNGF